MFFKNLQLYRLRAWALAVAELEEALERRTFTRVGSQDLASRGFVPPMPGGPLVFSSNGEWLIALRTEQRMLPSKVVKQATADRAAEIEDRQGYKPGRKQMKEIKEAVIQELLPRAFTDLQTTYCWISPRDGWIGIDATTPSRADELLETLRDVLAELPLQLLDTERTPVSCMGEWLATGEAAENFTIDDDCELRGLTDGCSVAYRHHTLSGEDIPAHLAGGKVPTRLALTFDDRISFVLTERLEVKRLGFLDIVQEQAEKAAINGDEQFEADFVLMTSELLRFIPHLIGALGGERKAA
jgi:recombination associated protein RdgC